MKLQIERAENVVQPRAQSAAGYDGNLGASRVEEEMFARTGTLEERAIVTERIAIVHAVVNERAFDRAERVQPQRRAVLARAEIGDGDLLIHAVRLRYSDFGFLGFMIAHAASGIWRPMRLKVLAPASVSPPSMYTISPLM